MPQNAEFFMRQGEDNANETFLLEYQKCILLALEKEGILDQRQLEECITAMKETIL